MVSSFWRFLQNPFQPTYMGALVVINFLGSLYGYYWYGDQLAHTPWYFWPFTPDSPLSTTLFTVTLLLFLLKQQPLLLALLACVGVIKYGIWAVIINAHFWRLAGEITPVTLMLVLSHLGMAVEGLIYLRHLKITAGNLAFLIFWLAINDFLDYGLGIHPYLYGPQQWTVAMVSAIGLSTSLMAYVVLRKMLGSQISHQD